MKDQKRLLHKCLIDDIPAFVLCGTDILAIATLKKYLSLAIENGCDEMFTEDLKLLIRDFELYKEESEDSVCLPS